MAVLEKTRRPVFTLKRLRLALLLGAALLVAVVVGYIGYGRYKLRQLSEGVRAKLAKHGFSVQNEGDGIVKSQYEGSRKIYTLRTGKYTQHGDGLYTLHQVGIEMYGKVGDRVDRIHGDEFEWDEKAGVMRAVGEAFIDLQAPKRVDGKDAGPGEEEARTIHLKTNGMVFNQKSNSAETDSEVDFRAAEMTGQALGASYDSTRGVVVLRSAVKVSGIRNDKPMVLTAAHAELFREGDLAVLEGAKLVETGEGGVETGAADHAVVHMTSDGTPERVDANGKVTLTGGGRGTVISDKMVMNLNAAGAPKDGHLWGGVRFSNEDAARREQGKADDARLAFDAQGRPAHAVMTGAVEAQVTAGKSVRWLQSEKLEMALAGGGKERLTVRGAEASGAGGARMRLVDEAKGKIQGTSTTNVRADVLKGLFAAVGGKTQATGMDGTGKTIVERTLVDTAGVQQWKETGTGDVLKMDFKSDAKGHAELARAEQRGSVKVVREALGKPKKGKPAAMEVEHAEGDVAVYDADADRMTMTGGVKVSDAESALFADRVQADRATGEGTAEGGVRVTYVGEDGTGEPIHVMGARAVSHKSTGITEFFGKPGGLAKMWQAGSQVEAPAIDFDRTKKMVTAKGANAGDVAAVKTVLVDAQPDKAKKPAKEQAKGPGGNGPVRIVSREMIYTDATRQVEFHGPVRVVEADSTLRSQEAVAYLAPADPRDKGAPMAMSGRVERIVATGAVEIEQPGRKATGEKLLYTTADETSLLTGTKAAPPKMVDETQGSITGASLRFHSGDDSVEVLGGDGRVKTETRMKSKD